MDQSSPSSRPRTTSRAFSHKSDHSRSSKHEVLVDNPVEKQRRDSFWKGGSKANPNAAMNEAQPGDAAILEKSTLESLRHVQHKDSNGNIITEPDLSNPTRPRWERPLDTIRSFERAIDGGYKRRSASRSESYTYSNNNNNDQSRRSSYYGGNNHDSARYENGSQYGGGHYASRRQDGHSDVSVPGGPHGRNPYARRMNSASRSNSAYGFYPQHAYNDSYDANGQYSDGTGPWANSTDPSSENSSLDRAHGVPKQTDSYGHDIYNGPPIMEEYASDSDGGYGMPGGQRHGAPGGNPAAHSQAPPVRAPIKLSGGDGAFASQGGSLPPTTRPTAVKEEKKGFFKKRFSKG